MADTSTGSGGVGFAGLLTVAFIVLKLTENIAWSWWWVLSPLWISAAVGLLALLLILAGVGVSHHRRTRRYSRRSFR